MPKLVGWLEAFLAGTQQFVVKRNEAPLEEAIAWLSDVRAAIASSPRRRPWLTLWTLVDVIVGDLAAVADSYLSCFEARTPIDAQQRAELAQGCLDRAAADFRRFGDELDAWSALVTAEDTYEPYLALLELTARKLSAATVLDVERGGLNYFSRIVGDDRACPVGLGTSLSLLATEARTALDESRLWGTAESVYLELRGGGAPVDALRRDSQFRSDFAAVPKALFDAQAALHAVGATARGARQEVGALLAFAHALIEGPAHTLLSARLSVARRIPYRTIRPNDIGGVIDQLSQRGAADDLLGVDRVLRHAFAHRDFVFDESRGVVVLGERTSRSAEVDVNDLVDGILAGYESMAAHYFAFLCLLRLEGDSFDESLDDLGFSDAEIVRLLAALSGLRNPTAAMSSSDVVVGGSYDGEPTTLLNLTAAMTPYLRPDSTHARFEISCDADKWSLEGALEPFRRFSATTDEVVREASLIEVRATWLLDGVALWDRNLIRTVVARRVAQVLDGELRACTRLMKELWRLALRLDDMELARTLSALLAGTRSRALGLPQTDDERRDLELLASWIGGG